MVKHINGEQLEELIAHTDKMVFCDFWANWCGPCRMLGPVFEAVSNKYEEKAIFVKIDVDDEASEAVARKYQISSIPIYFDDNIARLVCTIDPLNFCLVKP